MIDAWVIERDDGQFFSGSGWDRLRAATVFGMKREAVDAILEHRGSHNPLFSVDRSYHVTQVQVDDEGRTVAMADVSNG